jgi:hypothetical protein
MDYLRGQYEHIKEERERAHTLERLYKAAKTRWLDSKREGKLAHADLRGGLLDFELYYGDNADVVISLRRVFHQIEVRNSKGLIYTSRSGTVTEYVIKSPLNPHDNPPEKPNPLLEGVDRVVLVLPRTKREGKILGHITDFKGAQVEWQTPEQELVDEYHEAPIGNFKHTLFSVIHHLEVPPVSITAYVNSENPSPVVIK